MRQTMSNLRKNFLNNLAELNADTAVTVLSKEIEDIAAILRTESDYNKLKSQIELLESFAYRLPQETISIVIDFLERLKDINLTYDESLRPYIGFYSRFYTRETLIVMVLELIKYLRYLELDKVLAIFLSYSLNENEKIKKAATDGLIALAKFNISVWSKIGPEPQLRILEVIEDYLRADPQVYIEGIIIICEALLSPTLEDTVADYQSLTWKSAEIPICPEIQDIRNSAIKILESLYNSSEPLENRKMIINALDAATRRPHLGEYKKELLDMVNADTARILNIYHNFLLSDSDVSIFSEIEESACWYYQNSDDRQILKVVGKIKNTLDAHQEYQFYRILIGYNYIFNIWEKDEKNTEKASEIRDKKIEQLAISINASNFSEWRDRIIRYAQISSNDAGTFIHFGQFLEIFGRKSPELAIHLLTIPSGQLQKFIVGPLLGIWSSSLKAKLVPMIHLWINEGKYLWQIARIFQHNKNYDLNVLESLAQKAIEESDPLALREIITAIAANYCSDRTTELSNLFAKIIRKLEELQNADWVFTVWFRKELQQLLRDLDEEISDIILSNMIILPRINHEAESILTILAEKYPDKVIKFFGERLKSPKEDEDGHKYDAIPYDFHSLQEPLSKNPALAISIIGSWYDDDRGLFTYRGGKLLHNIFPTFSVGLQNELVQLIKSGEDKNITMVMAILRTYKGEIAIHNVCKELIKVLPKDSSYLNEIEIIIENMGVVSGEYGMMDAYKNRKSQIETWLSDNNEKVQAFAARSIETLGGRIEYEKNRADEDIALRKYKYGTGDKD